VFWGSGLGGDGLQDSIGKNTSLNEKREVDPVIRTTGLDGKTVLER